MRTAKPDLERHSAAGQTPSAGRDPRATRRLFIAVLVVLVPLVALLWLDHLRPSPAAEPRAVTTPITVALVESAHLGHASEISAPPSRTARTQPTESDLQDDDPYVPARRAEPEAGGDPGPSEPPPAAPLHLPPAAPPAASPPVPPRLPVTTPMPPRPPPLRPSPPVAAPPAPIAKPVARPAPIAPQPVAPDQVPNVIVGRGKSQYRELKAQPAPE